ncbi:Cytoplasmic GTPase/eEF2-like protein (ribosomal biogenesis) [Tulasnella sp. JGI-2019a]|nr:Cytoplasmic GTPase/eEF2-like protein (ribosomal biogenesis) [Tulasnella sp. JGI-2019a]
MADNQEQVRVITTIGHVDHGKTTFVDGLLVANNIISARMAGKIRYMDSREDEQERGITMESSAVSLRFKMLRDAKGESSSSSSNYVINLIDTPGHVDFSTEVSAASKLCDGALVLVDVVEGVCTQTITVLKQAWVDRLRPILVINKLDRLVTELKLSPIEGYHHLAQLIEQVNAVMGSFFASERMDDDLRWREARDRRLAERKDKAADTDVDAAATNTATELDSETFEEKDDEDIYFSPERGNVIFASAIDGWGFRIGKFAQLYAAKLGINEKNLRRVLWGDFYLDPKTKRIVSFKHLRGRTLKPLFVQFVLDNIWAVYENVMLNPNPDKVAKIVQALDLKILPRDIKSKDTHHLLSLIFSQWLPISTCTFQAVVDVIPPPSFAQRIRIPKILHPDQHIDDLKNVPPKNKLEEDLFNCRAGPDAFVVAYVSKMFAVPQNELPEHKRKTITAEEMRAKGREAREARLMVGSEAASTPVPLEKLAISEGQESKTPVANDDSNRPTEVSEDESLLGFSRLYSGTITRTMKLYCTLPKYNASLPPTHPSNAKHIAVVDITALYVMMGRDLVPAEKVTAGNVFALAGLGGIVWRNATLCAMGSTFGTGEVSLANVNSAKEYLVNLAGIPNQAAPIVRVALEPKNPVDMPKLVKGLRLLSQADPCVETFQQQTGEYVILTAGELHLERCLKDLRERFAKADIQASQPIVPFREVAVRAPDMAHPKTPNAARGTIHGSISQNLVTFTIRAVPLPQTVTDFLLSNVSILKRLHREGHVYSQTGGKIHATPTEEYLIENTANDEIVRQTTVKPEEFFEALEKLFKEAGGDWVDVADKVWAFGPHRVGPNVLVDRMGGTSTSLRKRSQKLNLLRPNTRPPTDTPEGVTPNPSVIGETRHLREFDDCIDTGFQLATFQGALCAEPMQGMAFFIDSIQVGGESGAADVENIHSKMAQVTGSLISAVKEACRSGFMDWSPRLMLAMYTCDIQAATDVLGKMYGVVSRRRGRIVSEEMKEGTSFFSIRALLPVVESFGFADEIRKRTSGAASPQLIFSGYEILDQDPFWVPTTEEELEDLGEKADRANLARSYMDAVRKRKGMFVEQKIVEHAEKQRTLKK